MRILHLPGALALMAICLTPLVARAEQPPADRIVIDVVTVNGSGCRVGTSAVAVSPDNTAFTVQFSDYAAGVGPGFGPVESRRNCQLNLRVRVPSGYTYAIAGYDHVGFLSLAQGAQAMLRSEFHFQGQSSAPLATWQFQGPREDEWQVSNRVEPAALIYAPCGEQRSLNLNTEIRVMKGASPPSATSFMSMDTGGRAQLYQLVWKRCP